MGGSRWLRRASAASRYALGACSALMAWALRARAPAASLITASRSALGAEGAVRLCIGRAGCHRRLALCARRRGCGRCAPGCLRQPSRCLALRARRRRRGRYAPGRVHLLSPRYLRTLPLGGGDVEDVVRFALIETLVARRASRSCRRRGWEGVFQTLSCTSVRGNACVLAQHVQCESARRATGTGAPYPQARPTPRTLSARAPLHAAVVGAS